MKKILFFSMLLILMLFSSQRGFTQVKKFSLSVQQPSLEHCLVCICKEFDNQFKVFPNPSRGDIKVTFLVPVTGTKAMIQIISPFGKVFQFYEENIRTTFFQKDIGLSTLPKGVYLIKISEESFVETKIIILY